jgi:hypothetical protein
VIPVLVDLNNPTECNQLLKTRKIFDVMVDTRRNALPKLLQKVKLTKSEQRRIVLKHQAVCLVLSEE